MSRNVSPQLPQVHILLREAGAGAQRPPQEADGAGQARGDIPGARLAAQEPRVTARAPRPWS